MKRSIVVGVVGLCAFVAFLLSKRASPATAQPSVDLRRWEDDGGLQPEVHPHDGRRPAVTVDIHST